LIFEFVVVAACLWLWIIIYYWTQYNPSKILITERRDDLSICVNYLLIWLLYTTVRIIVRFYLHPARTITILSCFYLIGFTIITYKYKNIWYKNIKCHGFYKTVKHVSFYPTEQVTNTFCWKNWKKTIISNLFFPYGWRCCHFTRYSASKKQYSNQWLSDRKIEFLSINHRL
jgi:hypothetical protein